MVSSKKIVWLQYTAKKEEEERKKRNMLGSNSLNKSYKQVIKAVGKKRSFHLNLTSSLTIFPAQKPRHCCEM